MSRWVMCSRVWARILLVCRGWWLLVAGWGWGIAWGLLWGGAWSGGAGWRWIFWVNVPVGLGAFVVGLLRMPAIPGEGGRRVDWPGLVSFSAGLALLVFGLLRG